MFEGGLLTGKYSDPDNLPVVSRTSQMLSYHYLAYSTHSAAIFAGLAGGAARPMDGGQVRNGDAEQGCHLRPCGFAVWPVIVRIVRPAPYSSLYPAAVLTNCGLYTDTSTPCGRQRQFLA